jgi:hypothetical protein
MLRVLRGLNLGRWTATGVLVVDLHNLLAGRLVAGLWLGRRLRIGCLPLAPAHQQTVQRPQPSSLDPYLDLAARDCDLDIPGA